MIIFRDEDGKRRVDKRHCVSIKNSISFASAVVVDETKMGGFESVMYMTDDYRTWQNEAYIDATEEEMYNYRKYINRIKIGDKVKIISGRKYKGETKIVKEVFNYIVPNTFGKQKIQYIVFTDNTKVAYYHCVLI